MNIKDTFLKLTDRTYPHGTEKDLIRLLPNFLEKDEFDNLFVKIGDSDVMFTSHLDTATSTLIKVNHVIEGNIIKTDEKSILGADDKAGVTIMLYMIENKVPGLYYFFIGEEVGCIGSKKVADKNKIEKIEGINKVISFDRRGTKSVITYQTGRRCASDKFAEALSKELNSNESSFKYELDTGGIITDSAQFMSIYPECTNISVGYQSEHTILESQDIDHLEKLAIACTKIDWNKLPIERDPSKIEYKSYNHGGYSNTWDEWDDYYSGYGSYRSYTNSNNEYRYSQGYTGESRGYSQGSRQSNYRKPVNEKTWFIDKAYNQISNIEINKETNKIISVDLCEDRIKYEKYLILNLLDSLELEFKSIDWDGFKLMVYHQYEKATETDRNELIEYLTELDYNNIIDWDKQKNSYEDKTIYTDYSDF